jgi:hypothetical protein
MSQLETLQKQFQDYLLGETQDITPAIQAPDTSKNFAKKRLDIYGHAYFLRLLAILKGEFPAILTYLGEDEFEDMAFSYLDVFPSRSPSVRYIGQHLSRFLGETFPYCQQEPILSELATFEWVLSNALDLPDAPVLTKQALTNIPESAWPDIRFVLHPSVQQVTLHWNVSDVRATQATPIRNESPTSWVVWRKGIMPYYLSLTQEEAWLLQEMGNGYTFEELCKGLSECLPEEEVPSYIVQRLLRWLDEEMLSEILCP